MTTIRPDARDVEESGLQLGEEIGRGGQGSVHRVLGRPNGVVFKRYKVAGANPIALKMLVDLPWSLQPAERERLLRLSAWPLARVMRQGQVSGFLMQEIPARFYAPNSRGIMMARELQYLLYKRKPAWGKIVPGEVGVQTRVEVAMEFAKLVHLLHGRSVVIGDVSMKNVLWAPGIQSSIFLIDCDGVSRLGSPPVLPHADTPDWDDPAQSASRPDLDTDRYKLGLLVGRVLSGSPYLRPGAELPLTSDLPVSIALQVRKLWAWAAGPRGARPSAVDWITALNGGVEISSVHPGASRNSAGPTLDHFTPTQIGKPAVLPQIENLVAQLAPGQMDEALGHVIDNFINVMADGWVSILNTEHREYLMAIANQAATGGADLSGLQAARSASYEILQRETQMRLALADMLKQTARTQIARHLRDPAETDIIFRRGLTKELMSAFHS